ncbi:MAG: CRISPR system precrRNA processing endoribonuclease RAMP protein Cas6 [Lachnospiraceae bacterium]|jgi:hypothetical protein|nr:CRISPR system precrRNA processing endoribonuclease RAMP protein Cas6 [Lachnospiraceae bacterium]
MNEDIYKIRYVKLHFTAELIQDTTMPKYKASALRGGMGEMLLRANCIRDRNCEMCDFESECIVRRTMYSQMEIRPAFMTAEVSVGYVIECGNHHEDFKAGDRLDFNLILFGKTIVYFSQFLNAFYALGMQGIGKEKSRFRIISVKNSGQRPIMEENNIYMKEYEILSLGDYITYRKRQLQKEPPQGIIRFQSPLSMKYNKEIMTKFQPKALLEGICRRLYILACFEGIHTDPDEIRSHFLERLPEVLNEQHYFVQIRRYSNRKDAAMYLKGIEGSLTLQEIRKELLDLLLAGELIHIGSNTSFGFGKYRLL